MVTRVPTADEIAELHRRHPWCTITLAAEQGVQLSELGHQNSYRFIIGRIYIGADTREQLAERFDAVVRELPFEFESVGDEEASVA